MGCSILRELVSQSELCWAGCGKVLRPARCLQVLSGHCGALIPKDGMLEVMGVDEGSPLVLCSPGQPEDVLHGCQASQICCLRSLPLAPCRLGGCEDDLAVIYLLQLPSLFPEEEKIDE